MLDKKAKIELARLKDRPIQLDDEDSPEITDWSEAERGRFYRPVKQQVTLRLDADVLMWFKSRGKGYQTRINRVLREFIKNQSMGQ